MLGLMIQLVLTDFCSTFGASHNEGFSVLDCMPTPVLSAASHSASDNNSCVHQCPQILEGPPVSGPGGEEFSHQTGFLSGFRL